MSLPQDYLELEYIENVAGCFISIPTVSTTKWELVCKYVALTNNTSIMGTGDIQGWSLDVDGNAHYCSTYYFNGEPVYDSSSVDVYGKVTIVCDDGNIDFYEDGVLVDSITTLTLPPKFLFTDRSTSFAARARIYRFTVWDGNTKTMELVPCVDDVNGCVGLYDIVNNEDYRDGMPYPNYGMFLAGPVVDDTPQVSYDYKININTDSRDVIRLGNENFYIPNEQRYLYRYKTDISENMCVESSYPSSYAVALELSDFPYGVDAVDVHIFGFLYTSGHEITFISYYIDNFTGGLIETWATDNAEKIEYVVFTIVVRPIASQADMYKVGVIRYAE